VHEAGEGGDLNYTADGRGGSALHGLERKGGGGVLMARHISVYRREDLAFLQSPPDDVTAPVFDRWSDEASRRCLYDAPLGSESAVRELWSAPAEVRGLPRIASIYDRGYYGGFKLADGQLDELESELLGLETYWNALALAPEVSQDLRERLDSVRAAIGIARKADGVLMIS